MSELETIRFPVAGMTCVSCVGAITRALRRVDGVSGARVDLAREIATVTRERGIASDAALSAALAAAGYQADLGAAITIPAPEARGLLDRVLRRSR